MKHIGRALLIAGMIVGATVEYSQAAALTDAVKKTISANENYLKRFRKELEALAGAQDETSSSKRSSLEQKIKNLEAENARLQGTAPSSPAPKKSAPTAVKAEPPAAMRPVSPAPSAATGSAIAEWEKMTREQKEQYVQSLVDEVKRGGQSVERHPLFYTALMDYVFVSDAALAAKPLKEAVLATIQRNETSLRSLQKT